MKKIAKILASFAALAFVVAPAVPASAYSEGASVSDDGAITVSTEADLREALVDPDVRTVILGANLENISSPIVISRPITLNGNDKTVTVGDSCKNVHSKWGCQAIQVYEQTEATTTIQDINLKGGLAGIQNNGSNVTLKGTITFADNEWGGIEITKGDGVTSVPVTNFTDVKIVNSSETAGQPTVWTDKLTVDEINITFDGAQAVIFKDQDAGQVQFFLDNTNAQKALEDTDLYSELGDSPMADVKVEIGGVPTPEPTPGDDTDTDTPEVTEPVKDEEAPTDEADVAAPNTGTTIANFALVLTGITVAVLTAVYATRFASAKK